MIHTGATPGHDIGITAATLGVAHDTHPPHTAIDPTMTHHTDLIADHRHIEILNLTTTEIVVDHVHIHPTNPQGKLHTDNIHIPANHKANHTSRT